MLVFSNINTIKFKSLTAYFYIINSLEQLFAKSPSQVKWAMDNALKSPILTGIDSAQRKLSSPVKPMHK